MSAAPELFAKPSASLVLSLLRGHAPGPHREFAEAIQKLDWDEFAEAVSAMQRSVPAVLGPDDLTLLLAKQEAHENSGVEIIGYVADSVRHPRHRSMMKAHAADESRHSGMFLALRRLLSPGKAVAALTSDGPDPFIARYRGDLGSFLWDTHFAEINSIFYLEAIRGAVSHPETAIARKIDAALVKVIADERRHVASTATILSETFADDPLMEARMQASFDDHVPAIREQVARLTSVPA
jgi:rubrerythrin